MFLNKEINSALEWTIWATDLALYKITLVTLSNVTNLANSILKQNYTLQKYC